MSENLYCNIYPVTRKPFSGTHLYLEPYKTYTLILDYPLSNVAKFKIRTRHLSMDTLSLINKICDCYQKVYQEPEKYGIWGHDIDDLAIEGISVDHNKKEIRLTMGS